MIVKSNFVTLCLDFKGSIPTILIKQLRPLTLIKMRVNLVGTRKHGGLYDLIC